METTTIDIDTDLDTARGALQRFKDATPRSRLVRRLETTRPMHPVLILRRLAMASGAALVVGALGWLTVVALGLPLPAVLQTVLATSAGALAPALMLGLAVCAGAVAVCAGEVASILGEEAPFLPDEAKTFQKLQSEVLRTSARQSVRARMRAQ